MEFPVPKIQFKFCIHMQVTLEFPCFVFHQLFKFVLQNIRTTLIDITIT